MEPLIPQQNHTDNPRIDLWVDERIWGHRFYNDQTPWLILLEFFGVFRDRQRSGRALTESRPEGQHEEIHYNLLRLSPLRYLIFNNPHLQHVEESVQSNDARWQRWLQSVADNPTGYDFSYLRDRFEEFSRLVRVIEFYRNTAVESHRQRRWTSRFVFPYGIDCVYADLDERGGLGRPDRRFFARGGELLYLMLNRSSHRERLAASISDRLMRAEDRWNRMVHGLLPDTYEPEQDVVRNIPVGYLPYAERREYDGLAEDWLTLLELKVPGAAILDPLMRITALHMMLYMLRRSHEEIGDGAEPRFLLEIAAPRKTMLFDLSSESYSANRVLPRRALEAHLEAVRHRQDWQQALTARDPAREAFGYLKRVFHWKREHAPDGDPPRILDALIETAVGRHNQHVGKVLPEWSRRIGLLTSRRGVGTWYSPNDAFLKALVLATVREREEYHRFLATLYERYRIVIGVAEAERAYGALPTDERVLTTNAARLEQRLRTLGLLHRLSDDCAYVTNPFRSGV